MTVPDRTTFENVYAGQAPWDIGRPQKAFIDVADQITGSILDAGCGTGENALFFASEATRSRASTSSPSRSPGRRRRQPSGA